MLKLDKTAHDIYLDNFSFAFIDNKSDDLAQRLKVKLLFFQGEWVFNEQYGVPYFQRIFVKGTSKEDVDIEIREQISSERDVDTILSYNSLFDSSKRSLTITTQVRKTDGEVLSLSFTI